ncbi:MAG: hypothetical protein AAGK23_03365 [Pseudomonadota bacterium]
MLRFLASLLFVAFAAQVSCAQEAPNLSAVLTDLSEHCGNLQSETPEVRPAFCDAVDAALDEYVASAVAQSKATSELALSAERLTQLQDRLEQFQNACAELSSIACVQLLEANAAGSFTQFIEATGEAARHRVDWYHFLNLIGAAFCIISFLVVLVDVAVLLPRERAATADQKKALSEISGELKRLNASSDNIFTALKEGKQLAGGVVGATAAAAEAKAVAGVVADMLKALADASTRLRPSLILFAISLIFMGFLSTQAYPEFGR